MRDTKDRDYVDRWFQLNLNVKSRTIFMGSVVQDYDGHEGGVDNYMAEFFIKGMNILEEKPDPVMIIMNNPGGDWNHGMAIYDAIKYSRCECSIKVYGHAMSMGSIILQASDKRIMMPSSKFMVHYGYASFNNHAKVVDKWVDENKWNDIDMENIYIEKMMIKEAKEGEGYLEKTINSILVRQNQFDHPQYKKQKDVSINDEEDLRVVMKEKMLVLDTILTAEETVSLGLADEVFDVNKLRN